LPSTPVEPRPKGIESQASAAVSDGVPIKRVLSGGSSEAQHLAAMLQDGVLSRSTVKEAGVVESCCCVHHVRFVESLYRWSTRSFVPCHDAAMAMMIS
jgi:hypothetical protein